MRIRIASLVVAALCLAAIPALRARPEPGLPPIDKHELDLEARAVLRAIAELI